MNAVDKMMAWAQVVLSAIFIIFVAVVFVLFETGHAHLQDEQLKIFERLLEWLTGAALVILYFWFQRQRIGGIPDAPMITQTQTGPDGSKTSITSPAHLPLPTLPNPTQPPQQAAK